MNISNFERRELFVCLTDSILEVERRVDYILHPRIVPSEENMGCLHHEIGDMLAIIDRLVDLGVLSGDTLDACVERKMTKLENYILFKNDTDIVNY
jgi:hypothetical protein